MTARSRPGMGWGARIAAVALPLSGVATLLLLWWLFTVVRPSGSGFIRRFGPDEAFTALRAIIGSGEVWPHLLASLRRVLVGLAVATAIGVPVGLLVGWSRTAMRATGVVFQFLRMISPLSWTPVAIIVFGVGDTPVYFLIAIGAVWPVILNTSAGVAALDPRWLAVGRGLGANRLELLTTIVWPGIRPHLLTGLRLAVGLAWIILVPAEMLGVDSGLGYFILDSRDRLAYGEVIAIIMVVGACGFGLDLAARFLFRERRRPRSAARARSEATTRLSGATEPT